MGPSSWFLIAVAPLVVSAASIGLIQESSSDRARALLRERLGVELATSESRIRRSITSTRTPYGFLIRRVEPGSLAERAGLHAGDVLLEWDGVAIRDVEPLAEWIALAAARRAAVPVVYSRKRPNVPLTFPATDPWQNRCTKLRFDRAGRSRRPGPV